MTSRFSALALRARDLTQFAPYAFAVLSLSSILLLNGCSAGADAQSLPPADTSVPVRVAPLSAGGTGAAQTITVTGTLAGKEEVALAFKIGGVIETMTVDPGQSVRAGQVLARLRPTEIAAQVANAQQARSKAERDLARVTRLYADSVSTLEQLQDARTALDVASNSVRIAQFNADYAVIRAPGDGIVLSRQGEPGQVVEAGRAVLSVRRNRRGMIVRVGLPDRDAVGVRIGDTAVVRFDAIPGTTYAARVTQRAAAATSGTGDYVIEVTLTEAVSTLPSGLVARVSLQPARNVALTGARVLVPLDALVDADADSAAVFVLRADGHTVSRRTIRLSDVTEALHTAQAPVVSGLDGNEIVVTAGMSRLLDGSRVRVITGAPPRTAVTDAAPQWRAVP